MRNFLNVLSGIVIASSVIFNGSVQAKVNPSSVAGFALEEEVIKAKGIKATSKKNPFQASLLLDNGQEYTLASQARRRAGSSDILRITMPKVNGNVQGILKLSGGNVARANAETFPITVYENFTGINSNNDDPDAVPGNTGATSVVTFQDISEIETRLNVLETGDPTQGLNNGVTKDQYDDLVDLVNGNGDLIQTNASGIQGNRTKISQNSSGSQANLVKINQNTSTGTANNGAIQLNKTDINTLKTQLANLNTTVSNLNLTGITTNTTAIQLNKTDINTLKTQLANLNTTLAGLSTTVSNLNLSGITQNATNIQSNQASISANTTSIQQNTTGIAANTTGIQTNATALNNINTTLQQINTILSNLSTRVGALESNNNPL
jgi:hypothetical protein